MKKVIAKAGGKGGGDASKATMKGDAKSLQEFLSEAQKIVEE